MERFALCCFQLFSLHIGAKRISFWEMERFVLFYVVDQHECFRTKRVFNQPSLKHCRRNPIGGEGRCTLQTTNNEAARTQQPKTKPQTN